MLIRNTIALVVPLHQQGWNHLTHDPSVSCHPVRVQYQQAAHRWQELYMMMTLMMMMSTFMAHGCINLNAQCTHDRAHAGGMFYSQLWECLLQTGLTVAVPSKWWQVGHHWWKLFKHVYDCFCILWDVSRLNITKIEPNSQVWKLTCPLWDVGAQDVTIGSLACRHDCCCVLYEMWVGRTLLMEAWHTGMTFVV